MSEVTIPSSGTTNASATLIENFRNAMDKLLSAANVNAVYGGPIKNGEILIIPTAEVLSVMGMGFGSGSAPSAEGEGSPQGQGSGGGGGGRSFSRPVAVVVASPESVRVEPVVDLTKIALAAFTAAGFMAGMWLRMMRQPQERR
jgi:uncharacterized spore protein YtfJ